MIDIKTILAAAIENNASDVHINVGLPPVLRKDTELIDMDCPPVTNQEVRAILLAMVGPEKLKRFRQFVNAPDTKDETVVFVEERGQIRPANEDELQNIIAKSA